MTIRPLSPGDSMAEMTALVRSAYGQLAEMGFRYWGTWQREDDTRHRCGEGHCLVAEEDGRLVGTVTVKRCNSDDEPEWYLRDGVWVVTQFGVLPELQGAGLGSRLLIEAERHAFMQGATEAAIDTAEGAAHLIEFYAQRGYRHVGRVDWEGTNYVSVVMSKRLRPVLTTERLLLRDLVPQDIAEFQSHWADARFQSVSPPGRMTPEFAEELFSGEIQTLAEYPRRNHHWAIVLEGRMIGGVRLTLEGSSRGTIGYGLAADYWRRGYASEAVREVVRYGFEELRLHRLQAWVYSNNEASQRLLEKLGFVHEGTLREKAAWGDGWVDDRVYGLLEREWAPGA